MSIHLRLNLGYVKRVQLHFFGESPPFRIPPGVTLRLYGLIFNVHFSNIGILNLALNFKISTVYNEINKFLELIIILKHGDLKHSCMLN